MDKVNLKIDWCSHEAAKYAVMNWHYSKRMPKSKIAHVGIWENDIFIGTILYGSSANNGLGKRFGLSQFQCCELVRIALKEHITFVSKLISISINKIKKQYPKLKVIFSYADKSQNHIGAIYQASNWVYIGESLPADEFMIMGKRWHGRAIRSSLEKKGYKKGTTLERIKKYLDPNAYIVKGSAKHQYIYPLTREIKRQIEPLRKPYPKKCAISVEREQRPSVSDGATPIMALQNK